LLCDKCFPFNVVHFDYTSVKVPKTLNLVPQSLGVSSLQGYCAPKGVAVSAKKMHIKQNRQ